MNSNTLFTIAEWRDTTGRSYVNYDLLSGQPNSLLGYPVRISESMQDIGSNTFPIAFGDFRRGYLITRYGDFVALQDPYSAKGFVSVYYAQRYGGCILNDQAIKLLKCSAS